MLLALLPDIFDHIGVCLTGKDISTFALAIAADKHHADNAIVILKGMTQQADKRCTAYLQDDAPRPLLQTWNLFSKAHLEKLRTTAGLLDEKEEKMRLLSEWCAVLDYCEGSPARISDHLQEDYNKNAAPVKKCWLLGGGVVGGAQDNDGAAAESSAEAVFTSHLWSPELLYQSESWFSRENQFQVSFAADGLDSFEPASAVGVVSWKSGQVLRSMHERYDIEAGMLVSHAHQGSELVWLPNATKAIYGQQNDRVIERKLDEADLSWLTAVTATFDNHMLCTWEFSQNAEERTPEVLVRDGFAAKILRLLKLMENMDLRGE